MVSRFRRTLSFPKPTITTTINPPEKSYHVRSVSLPCRSHPLISQLNDELAQLNSWLSGAPRTSSWICDGLIMLKNLHDSVDDLLHLPKTQEALARQSDWVEGLLDEFLRFVDAYGIFRATLVSLKEEQSAAQVAIRRRDELKITAYVKARKKMDKELKKLVSTVRSIGKTSSSSFSSPSMVEFNDLELAEVFKEVNEVTVAVTLAMLNGISGPSMRCKTCIGWNNLLSSKKKSGEGKCDEEGSIREFEEVEVDKLKSLRKQGKEEVTRNLSKLEELETSIGRIEVESERVFRSLISNRVSLLNILTP